MTRIPYILAMCLFIVLASAMIVNAADRPIVREYEDHSARITFDRYVCKVPAFDSPQDRIVCVRYSR